MPITGNRPRLGSVPGRCKVDEGDRAMNRAWIPAGALAGVSVAGLIAIGPLLTDSLTTNASFPSTHRDPEAGEHARGVRAGELQRKARSARPDERHVPAVGARRRAQVAVNAASCDAGQVGYRRTVTPASHTSTAATTNVKPTPKPTTPTKKRPPPSARSARPTATPDSRAAAATRPASASRPPLPATGPDGLLRVTRGTVSRDRPAGTIRAHGAIAQLGERLDRTQEVSGSSPLSSIAAPASA